MTEAERVKAEQIQAPFTEEQVASLNEYQTSGVFHPFTCGRCRDELGTRFIRLDDGSLVPDRRVAIRVLTEQDRRTLQERLVLDDRLLVATPDGWTCPTCDMGQDWAWKWMADYEWRNLDWRNQLP